MVHAMQGRGEVMVGCVKIAPIVDMGEQEGCLLWRVWRTGQATVRSEGYCD